MYTNKQKKAKVKEKTITVTGATVFRKHNDKNKRHKEKLNARRNNQTIDKDIKCGLNKKNKIELASL
jgi:hypothetical protein